MSAKTFPPVPDLLKIFAATTAAVGLLMGGGLYLANRSWDRMPPGGDFTLSATKGNFSLHEVKGKLAVLYFGFTRCADVCPISLHKLSQALAKLNPAEQSDVIPIFISVDSRRDTPETAQKYVSFFRKNGIGLAGSASEIAPVAARYGASYMIQDEPGSALGYSVQHPTRFFLVDRFGRFRGAVETSAQESELIDQIRRLL